MLKYNGVCVISSEILKTKTSEDFSIQLFVFNRVRRCHSCLNVCNHHWKILQSNREDAIIIEVKLDTLKKTD